VCPQRRPVRHGLLGSATQLIAGWNDNHVPADEPVPFVTLAEAFGEATMTTARAPDPGTKRSRPIFIRRRTPKVLIAPLGGMCRWAQQYGTEISAEMRLLDAHQT
jgi:hypothetical protein